MLRDVQLSLDRRLGDYKLRMFGSYQTQSECMNSVLRDDQLSLGRLLDDYKLRFFFWFHGAATHISEKGEAKEAELAPRKGGPATDVALGDTLIFWCDRPHTLNYVTCPTSPIIGTKYCLG